MRDKGSVVQKMAETSQEIAQGTVQKLVNFYGGAARAVAEDSDDLSDDAFVAALHRYSEAKLRDIAQEAVNQAYRSGRTDELTAAAGELEGAVWRRSSVMEPNTCQTCRALNGTVIPGPGYDVTQAHEGPKETCLCLPYADIS